MHGMTDDEELELIRQRRIRELEAQQGYSEAVARQQAAQQQENVVRRQAALRQILEPDARDRLGRLRTAHPELAAGVEDQLITLARSGRVARRVTDAELRKILENVAPRKRETHITIKK